MTDIKRNEKIGGPDACEKLDYCLTQLQERGFQDGIDWSTELVEGLTVEEMIGALVHAEQELCDYDG